MFVDIVFPSKNEGELVSVAEKLGYSGLCFVYDYQKDVNILRQGLEKLDTKLKIYLGLLAEPADVRNAAKVCELVLVKGSAKNHDVLEKLPVDILFGSEFFMKRDAMHYRGSGLNQILCRLAAKNKVIIGFNLNMINESMNLPMILGRVMQNIVLCKKYRAEMAIFSGARKPYQMKGISDLMSFMTVAGLNQGDSGKTLKTINERIKKNIKKKSPTYIKEGIELIK